MTPGILYISYDGMLEPLGQSQVLAYLERLAHGRRIYLISFEKAADWANVSHVATIRQRIADAGMEWHPLRYTKRPPVFSTVWDMVRGAVLAVSIGVRERISLFHGRNILSVAMAWPARQIRSGSLVADIRGFWADERVDGGIIAQGGLVYRVLKWLERAMLRSADEIITLTSASVPYLRDDPRFGCPAAPITTIPTCADVDGFKIQGPPQRDPFVLGYIGSVGTWYLLDSMLQCFSRLKELQPSARLLVVNRHEQDQIRKRVRDLDIDESHLELKAVAHSEIPPEIARMSAGMALIAPAFSKISSAPTKLSEYLACGVPCLGSAGVGDMEEILERQRVGVALRGYSEPELDEAIRRLLELMCDPGLQQRCRAVAVEQFSLATGVQRYEEIYRRATCAVLK